MIGGPFLCGVIITCGTSARRTQFQPFHGFDESSRSTASLGSSC